MGREKGPVQCATNLMSYTSFRPIQVHPGGGSTTATPARLISPTETTGASTSNFHLLSGNSMSCAVPDLPSTDIDRRYLSLGSAPLSSTRTNCGAAGSSSDPVASLDHIVAQICSAYAPQLTW